jgi:hypothetical protein
MTIAVDAVYEGDGMLKLDKPVDLKKNEKVRIVIETTGDSTAGDDDPTGWKAIDSLMGIGKAVAPDVSDKHDDHLYSGPRE